MRLPADHDELAGEVAQQDVVLEHHAIVLSALATLRRTFKLVEAWRVLHVVCMFKNMRVRAGGVVVKAMVNSVGKRG